MPDIPYGINIPKSVIAVEFLPGAGRPLPYGTVLSPGVVVVSATEGVSAVAQRSGAERIDVDDIVHTLPVNAVLVRRQKGSAIPPDVERASGGSLPAGILLAPNVEIWLLNVRFELPAGVKLEAGATLGKFTQLCPSTILARDLEVLEWPRNFRLGIGNELVRLSINCDIPVGYVQVPYSRSELQSYGLGRDCFVVRLPHVLRLPSTQQLAETITVLTLDEIIEKHASNPKDSSSRMRSSSLAVGPSRLLSQLQSMNETLPAGSVFIMRDSKRFQLPSEMQVIPKSSLSQELRNILSDHNVAYPNDFRGKVKDSDLRSSAKKSTRKSVKQSMKQSVKRKSQADNGQGELDINLQPVSKAEKTYFDVVQLAPHFRFAPGTELAPGVVVQPRPHFLHMLPRWLELVRVLPVMWDESDNSKKDKEKFEFGQKLLSRLKFMRSSQRSELNPFIDFKYELPENTELVLIPDDVQVYSWGSQATGIEAVIKPADIFLPTAHFLVERPRNNAPPPGLQMGFAPNFKKLSSQYQLPPGIEV
jgi:hypothetical protein